MLVLQYCLSQVYVVMGGYGDDYLSSTEMLSEGEDTWREMAPLPRPLVGPLPRPLVGPLPLPNYLRLNELRSVSLGNVIYLTGQMIILIVWS